MGAPTDSIKQDNVEVLTYKYDGDSRYIATTTGIGKNVAITSMERSKRSFTVDLVLTNDIVSQVNYHGRTGGPASRDEQCAFL